MMSFRSSGSDQQLIARRPVFTKRDFLRWFDMMGNVTSVIVAQSTRTMSNVVQDSPSKLLTRVNVLKNIMRSMNNDNIARNRRKMNPDQWGEIGEEDLPDVDSQEFLQEKSVLRQQLYPQNIPTSPTKPPKPDHLKYSPDQKAIQSQLELVNMEAQEVSYHVLESSSILLNQHGNQTQPNRAVFSGNATVLDPITKYELENRKANRDWWQSHSHLLEANYRPTSFYGTPSDIDQKELCLEQFAYFLHTDCHLSRRRALDLARYFIDQECYNKLQLKEIIGKYSSDSLYEYFCGESDAVNPLICEEIVLISKALGCGVYQQQQPPAHAVGDKMIYNYDSWDDRLIKLENERNSNLSPDELLGSLHQEVTHLQRDLAQLGQLATNESTPQEVLGCENILSTYGRTVRNLYDVDGGVSPSHSQTTLSSQQTSSSYPSVLRREDLQTLSSVDQKLTALVTGMFSLYSRMDMLNLGMNALGNNFENMRSQLNKQENMMTSLLTEEFRVPKYAIIVPVEQISIRSFISSRFRLYFLCPITLQRANSGKDQNGYEITLTKEWIIKLAPILKIGIFALRVALAAHGIILPTFLSIPDAHSDTIQNVSQLLDSCLQETTIVDDIIAKSNSLTDIYSHFMKNKQFMSTAKVGFREVYNLLYALEVDKNERILPGSWIPKYTGLVLVHSSHDGTSEWVLESAANRYKMEGYDLFRHVENQQQAQAPPKPPKVRILVDDSPPFVSPLAAAAATAAAVTPPPPQPPPPPPRTGSPRIDSHHGFTPATPPPPPPSSTGSPRVESSPHGLPPVSPPQPPQPPQPSPSSSPIESFKSNQESYEMSQPKGCCVVM